MNILIIDDDIFTQRLISHNFLELGHTVTTADNGMRALALLESNKNIDMIVVDLFMPELSGPSFLLKIKNVFYGKLPLVVVVSGARNAEEFLGKLSTKYDYFLPKPIDFNKLNSYLKDLEQTKQG